MPGGKRLVRIGQHQQGGGMEFPHFVRVDRDGPDRKRHYVVHTHDPKFTLELAPDVMATDGVGGGVIKRVCVPNSWAGEYGRYAKMLTAAQEFFKQSGSPGRLGR